MVAVLFNAGVQLPVMLFVEVTGKAESAAPEQTGATKSNVGITAGLTVIVRVAVVAHSPAAGVKV